MKIIGCQLNIAWEDRAANFARVRHLLSESKITEGALLVLPEMFSTGFSMNVAAIREDDPSETEGFLAGIAREFRIFALGGLVTAGLDGFGHNEAVVFTPEGGLAARYRKIHPFSFGRETKHYAGGSEIVTFLWHDLTVCPFICYDLRFPEVFRIAVRRGAQMFVVIANWPLGRVHHWTALLQARAIENQAYVIGVNRAGNDPKLSYPGRSLVIDPRGEILADCGSEEGLVTAEIDAAVVQSWRSEFPALADLRPEFVPDGQFKEKSSTKSR